MTHPCITQGLDLTRNLKSNTQKNFNEIKNIDKMTETVNAFGVCDDTQGLLLTFRVEYRYNAGVGFSRKP